MKYRKEIDGLRALAVIPVIFFHAGFELFEGGYIGVDIFFVISGYLITTILIKDFENDRFSFLNFYERRIRRIIPALFFLILISIYFYNYFLTINKKNSNSIIIYGSGKAGISVYKELSKVNNVVYFIDDNKELHLRSIDGIPIVSKKKALDDIEIVNYICSQPN